jgi:hypothetical protein
MWQGLEGKTLCLAGIAAGFALAWRLFAGFVMSWC